MPVIFDLADLPVWADILIDEGGLKVMQRVRLYQITVVEDKETQSYYDRPVHLEDDDDPRDLRVVRFVPAPPESPGFDW